MGWKCSCQGLDVCNGDLREEKIHQGGTAPVFFFGALVINLHGNSPAAGAGMAQPGPSAPRCCRML